MQFSIFLKNKLQKNIKLIETPYANFNKINLVKKGRKRVTSLHKEDLFSVLCIHLFTFSLERNIYTKFNRTF